jgi:serine protease DegQ
VLRLHSTHTDTQIFGRVRATILTAIILKTKGSIPMTARFPRFASAMTVIAALTLAAPLTTFAAAPAQVPLVNGMPTLAPLVDKVLPAVVGIQTKAKAEIAADNPLFKDPAFRRFFGERGMPQPQERSAAGSGVIVDAKKGYVLTNFHVIDEANEITVSLYDRRVFTAKVVGKDERTDVALLQIDPKQLTQIPMGDSDEAKVGDYVVAIGNPFTLGQTVTQGIVSAKGRVTGVEGGDGFEDFIQTDAAINPGNSGGALINLRGELIGINTAIFGPGGNIGIGFAIPTNMVRTVMSQLTEFGEVRRGVIGVQIKDMDPELAKNLDVERAEGALIMSVVKGSPADKAGVKGGDVVIELDGKPLHSSTELRNRLGLTQVGTTVDLTILRDKQRKNVKVTIAKAPTEQVLAKVEDRPALEGARYSTADGSDKVKGVKVTEVEQNGRAFQIGLKSGDIIVAVNRKSVSNIDEFQTAMKESTRQTALFIKRQGEDVLLLVP